MDAQLIELAGRNWLMSQLQQAGIEVAKPERDHGVDLIAYLDPPQFLACPIQIKVSSRPAFTVYDKKYRGMLLVYVWYVDDSTKTAAYALTWAEAHSIAAQKGWISKSSWEKYGYWRVPSAGAELQRVLEPYRMTSEKWTAKIRQAVTTTA